MKKLLTSLTFLMFALFISAQSSVGKYQKFEYTFDASSTTALTASDWTLINSKNPFDKTEIILKARFMDSNGSSSKVEGYYYRAYNVYNSNQYHQDWPFLEGEQAFPSGGKKWQVRFAPKVLGIYTYSIEFYFPATNTTISVTSGSLNCTASSSKGFIHLNNGYDFSYADGEIYHPIGLNTPAVPEYEDLGPKINYYDLQFKRISENGGNHVRFWLNYPSALKLYGVVTKSNQNCEFYLNEFNLKDAHFFDKIIEKAEYYGIHLQVVLFTSAELVRGRYGKKHFWDTHSVYNANLDHPNCNSTSEQTNNGPCATSEEFFTNTLARRYQENYVRYVIDRFGYSTSIVSWEIMNEDVILPNVSAQDSAIPPMNPVSDHSNWEIFIRDILKDHDPYNRAVTTSLLGSEYNTSSAYTSIIEKMDFMSLHYYVDQFKNRTEYSNEKFFNIASDYRNLIHEKPITFGEAGSLGSWVFPSQKYDMFDPYGFSVKSDIWSSLFYSSMGNAEYWNIIEFIVNDDPNRTDMPASPLLELYNGLSGFAQDLPAKKNATFHITKPGNYLTSFVSPYQSIGTSMWAHYMITPDNVVYGWCQDDQFTINKLINSVNLGDTTVQMNPYVFNPISANRPQRNTANHYTFLLNDLIPNTTYTIHWYDTQTGNLILSETITSSCATVITIPAVLRNTMYGDVAFIAEPIHKNNTNGWEKVWGNTGSGNIDAWGQIANSDRFFAGDFSNSGREQLLCVQTTGPNKWITTLDFINGDWQWGWSNEGASHPLQIYLPYFQYGGDFLIGDFDGDGGDDILVNCPGVTTLFKYQNNNFVQVWTAANNHAVNPYKDGLSVGDIDGDGKTELIGHIQNSWTTTFKFVPVGGGNYDFVWNTSDAGSGPMVSYGEIRTGNFDGIGGDEAISFSSWATVFPYNGSSFQWGWSNGGSTSFGGWTYPLASNNVVLIGDLDNDAKDELFFIETGTTGDWATTMDFSLDGFGGFSGGNWNWNWSANPLSGNIPYINDWPLMDHAGEASKYMLINADGVADYLLAFRSNNIYCPYSKYQVSMYRSMFGNNKSLINTSQTSDDIYHEELEEENTWSVYPNPFLEEVSVELYNTEQVSTVQMYTTLGTLLTEITVPATNEKQKLSIDMSTYRNGMYIVVWNTSEGRKTKHITKM